MERKNSRSKFICLLALTPLFISLSAFSVSSGDLKRKKYEQLSGRRSKITNRDYWNKRYNRAKYVYGTAPARFLADNIEYIKPNGKVLDLGMGEGRHAAFLAAQGFKVVGVDISSVAVKKAQVLAKEMGVRFETVVTSAKDYKVKSETFDAIIMFYFVDREVRQKLVSLLKPGGVLIMETYTTWQRRVKGYENYERNLLVTPGELLTHFKGLKVLKFEEPIHKKSFTSSIILRKPKKAD